jgi:hypothetical protein
MSTPLLSDGAPVLTSGSGNSVSWTQTLTSNATAFVVLVGRRGGTGTSGITIAGQALALLVSSSNSGYSFDIWGLISPPTGSNLSVVVTNTGAPTFANCCGQAYDGPTAFGGTATSPAHCGELSTSEASLCVFGTFWNMASGTAVNLDLWPNYLTTLGTATVGAGGSLSQFFVGSVPGSGAIGAAGFGVDLVALTGLTTPALAAVELIGTEDNPPPAPDGTIFHDTRAGGAQDITVATSLADALTRSGYNNSTSPAAQFTTSFAKNPSGRAFVLPWTAGQANSLYLEKAGVTISPILCWQYKVWWGTVAGDGIAFGAVGDYDHFQPVGSGQSHKWFVLFRKDPGHTPPVPNDERFTIVYGKDTGGVLRGLFLDVDGRCLTQGTSTGGNTATTLNDTGAGFVIAGVSVGDNIHIYAGTGASATWAPVTSVGATQLGVASWPAGTPDATSQYRVLKAVTDEYFQNDPAVNFGVVAAINLNDFIGQVVTVTVKIKVASSPLALDGYCKIWINNQLWLYIKNQPFGDLPIGDIQMGGPTWNNPGSVRNFSDYRWDMVGWSPAS